MRKTLIAGNWKMNMGPSQTADYFKEITALQLNASRAIDASVCPPLVSLNAACANRPEVLAVSIGAQNVHYEDEGAYTGEVSTGMLRELQCEYVIVGHSERRQYFGETDAIINKKVKKCLEAGLIPIVCVGELLEERRENAHFDVVKRQLKDVMSDLTQDQAAIAVIAYEPVWAIGTGETATPEQAQEMHAFIRKELEAAFGEDSSYKTRILYGGSMKPDNAGELLENPDVDGGLIGGASLKPESFAELVSIAESVSGVK